MSMITFHPDIYHMLLSKIFPNLLHPLLLLYTERTAFIAVSAFDTIGCMFFQSQIVILGHHISLKRKIVILVDQTDI